MTLGNTSRSAASLLGLLLILSLCASADKKPSAANKTVDAGSFGIFINGKRVGTETFSIVQSADSSLLKAEIKVDDGSASSTQTCELQLSQTGDLRRYTWNEVSPGKAQAVVVPSQEFLMETMTPAPHEKPLEQPYILPPSTMILDDYFFTQRQLLAWRYLATSCRPQPGKSQCPLTRSQFGVLVPRQRTSLMVSMEYIGRERVPVHGQERELNRFNLSSEGSQWVLWLDDSYRLVRVLIAAEHTEVLRD